eukprot:evm.model.scf_1147.2 EVM.evm.TU.scf_1147.2   scf_1147:12856-16295(-)
MVLKPACSGEKADRSEPASNPSNHPGQGTGKGRGRITSPHALRHGSCKQGKQLRKSNARVQEAATECPLCVERMDATDLKNVPCPCGYQMCLFCYEKICKQYGGLCPGCRQPYGCQKPGSKSQENCAKSPRSLEKSRGASLASQLCEPSICLEGQWPLERAISCHNEHSRSKVTSWDDSQSTKWPTLQQGLPYEQRPNGFLRPAAITSDRQPESTCSSSIDYVTPSEVSTVVSNCASSIPSRLTTAEVFTVVGGAQKPVCVPLDVASLPDDPCPEGEQSLDSTWRAVRRGKISSREGAAHLMVLLSKLESEAGETLLSLSELKRRYSPCRDAGNGARKQPIGQPTQSAGGDSHQRGARKQPIGQPTQSAGGDSHQSGKWLEDKPSLVVSRPEQNALPISPPSDQITTYDKSYLFACNPPAFSVPMHPPAPTHSAWQPGPSLWHERGLTGVDMQMRTASLGGSSGQEGGGGALGALQGYDFLKLGQQGLATSALEEHHLQGDGGGPGFGHIMVGASHRDAVSCSEARIAANTGSCEGQVPQDVMRNGFEVPSFPHQDMSGGRSVHGIVDQQCQQTLLHATPQYIPPDIAAVQQMSLGGLHHDSSHCGHVGVPVALHQQMAERLRIEGGTGDRLFSSWK